MGFGVPGYSSDDWWWGNSMKFLESQSSIFWSQLVYNLYVLWSAISTWWESGFCKNSLGMCLRCCYLCLSRRNERSCDSAIWLIHCLNFYISLSNSYSLFLHVYIFLIIKSWTRLLRFKGAWNKIFSLKRQRAWGGGLVYLRGSWRVLLGFTDRLMDSPADLQTFW